MELSEYILAALDDADLSALQGRTACIKISYTEGEGLLPIEDES